MQIRIEFLKSKKILDLKFEIWNLDFGNWNLDFLILILKFGIKKFQSENFFKVK